MQTDEPWLESVARQLVILGGTTSAAEVLDGLLRASVVAAPRAALYLVRRGRLRGYRALGEGPESSGRIAAVDLPADEGWAARSRNGLTPVILTSDDLDGPRFGQSAAAETCVVWLSLEGKPMAALVAARKEKESPWSPQGLAILATYAQSRLDAELLRKRREAPVSATPNAPPAAATADSPPRSSPAPELEPAEASFTVAITAARSLDPADETGMVPFEPGARPKDPQALRVDDARRFARLVATDIRLYNEEAVLVGRRQRDLAQRLGDQMERGRESFHRRFSDLGAIGMQLVDDAYIEVLAAGDSTLLGLSRATSATADGIGRESGSRD